MPILAKKLVLIVGTVALLTGCDDSAPTQGNEQSFFSRLSHRLSGSRSQENETPTLMVSSLGTYHETLSGNYLASQFAQYRQDWSSASTLLDRVIQKDPSNTSLTQRAMVLAMQAGNSARAITLAQKVLSEDPSNVLALIFLAADSIKAQDYDQAAKLIVSLPESGIGNFIRPILMGWVKASEGEIPLKDTLVDMGPLQAYHSLLMADYLGPIKDADRYLANILASGESDPHVIEMIADVFVRQNRLDLSMRLYDLLIEQAKNDEVNTRYLSLLKDKKEDPQKAAETRIKTPAQGAAEAFFNMARVLYQEQSDESALVFTRIALLLAPENDDAQMILARLMVRNGHAQDALAVYNSLPPESRYYQDAHQSIAKIFEENGETAKAISALSSYYEKTMDPSAMIQIGDIHRNTENYPLAIKAYSRVLSSIPKEKDSLYWTVYYARGMSYERSGNLSAAVRDLETALSYRPSHPYILNYLGYSWADQGKNLDKALSYIQKAVNIRPDDGYIVDSLGWVYYKLGQYEDAVIHLEKAVELVPYDATINDHLGDAYWRIGRKSEARFQWERALNNVKDDEAFAAKVGTKLSHGISAQANPSVREVRQVVSP